VSQEIKTIYFFPASLQNSYISRYLEVSFSFKIKVGKVPDFQGTNPHPLDDEIMGNIPRKICVNLLYLCL